MKPEEVNHSSILVLRFPRRDEYNFK
jgi:hypothetical protein